MIGMHDFDMDHLQSLGFERFKLLRPRPGNMTGHRAGKIGENAARNRRHPPFSVKYRISYKAQH